MDSFNRFKELKEKIKELREESNSLCKAAFQDAAKGIFATHPQLLCFSWTQYTPYFNDGDPCEFSADTDYPGLTMKGEESTNEDEDEVSKWDIEWAREAGTMDARLEAGEAVVNFLSNFDDEDLEGLFDDHAKVTVYADRIDVDGYDHN